MRSGISKRDTLEEKSSSPSEAPATAQASTPSSYEDRSPRWASTLDRQRRRHGTGNDRMGKIGAFTTERLVQAGPQGGWVRSEPSGRAAGRRGGR